MRTLRQLLPLALMTLALPAWSGQAPAPIRRTQALRTGPGQPRDRSAQPARPAPVDGPATQPAEQSRPYRPSQPGEGAPKG